MSPTRGIPQMAPIDADSAVEVERIRPINDRVLVEPIESSDTTPGGIYLPDQAKPMPVRGRVVAVGSGKLLDNGERAPLTVKPGDVVLYPRYSGTEIKLADETVVMFHEHELLGVEVDAD